MSQETQPTPSVLVRRIGRNKTGRDLIVGDVHGCFSKLRAALDAVGFDPAAGDRLFSVGDLVDRGPESIQVLDWLDRPWFFAVRGNHEDTAMRWPNGRVDAGNYAANGGAWNIANPPEVQRSVADAFAALPVAIEIETGSGLLGLVHADCPFGAWDDLTFALETPGLSNARRGAVVDFCLWSRDRITVRNEASVAGVRAVVVGHTPVQQPVVLGNVLHIDTGGWMQSGASSRGFTILDAATLAPAVKPIVKPGTKPLSHDVKFLHHD